MKIFGLASSMLALCSSQAAVAAPSWVEKIRFTINISGKHFVNTSDGFSNMQKGRFFEGNAIAEFHEYPYTKDPKGHRLLLWNTKSCDGYYSIGDTGEVKGIDPIEGGGGTATSLYSLRASGETKNCSISIAMDSETRKVNVHISTGISRVNAKEFVNSNESDYDYAMNWPSWSAMKSFEAENVDVTLKEGSDYEHQATYIAKGNWPVELQGHSLQEGERVETYTRLFWELNYEKVPEKAPPKPAPRRKPPKWQTIDVPPESGPEQVVSSDSGPDPVADPIITPDKVPAIINCLDRAKEKTGLSAEEMMSEFQKCGG